MKNILLIIILTVTSLCTFGQDLIVTTEGDSINCTITAIKANNYYFTFKHETEIRETFIQAKDVVSYAKGYYKVSEVPIEYKPKGQSFSKFRIALDYGYSHRTAKVAENVPTDFKNYVEDLKNGNNMGLDLNYFVSESFGVGLKYNRNKSSNSMDNIYVEDDQGNRRYGKLSDDITMTFVGVSFAGRILDAKKRNAFIIALSLGQLSFNNQFVVVDPYEMNGSTFSTALDFGYDIATSKNFAIGVKFSIIGGVLTEYVLKDGVTTERIKLNEEQYESLSRIDISVGIRFTK
jgi:hypothetical protein